MQCMLTGFGVMVVASGKIVLEIDLEFSVLTAALA
jgi:hypothetical protein